MWLVALVSSVHAQTPELVMEAMDAGHIELARGRAMALPESFLADEARSTELALRVLNATVARARRAHRRPAYAAALARNVLAHPLVLTHGTPSGGLVLLRARNAYLRVPESDSTFTLVERLAAILSASNSYPCNDVPGQTDFGEALASFVEAHPRRASLRLAHADWLWRFGPGDGAKDAYRHVLRMMRDRAPVRVRERIAWRPVQWEQGRATSMDDEGTERRFNLSLGTIDGGRVTALTEVGEEGFGYSSSVVRFVWRRGSERVTRVVWENTAASSAPRFRRDGDDVLLLDGAGSYTSPASVLVRFRWEPATHTWSEIEREEQSVYEEWPAANTRRQRALRRGALAWARGELLLLGGSPDCGMHEDRSGQLFGEHAVAWGRKVAEANQADAAAYVRALMNTAQNRSMLIRDMLDEGSEGVVALVRMFARAREAAVGGPWLGEIVSQLSRRRDEPLVKAVADAAWDVGYREQAAQLYRRYIELEPQAPAEIRTRAGTP